MPTVIITNNTTGGDFTGTEDCTIASNLATTNDNTNDLSIRDSGPVRRVLVRFTGLSNITGPVTVSSVTLSLYLTGSSSASGRSVRIYKCLRPWTEGGVTYNAYDGSNSWGVAGATDAADRGSVLADINTPETPTGLYIDYTDAALNAVVEDWINNGSNNGFILDAIDSFADWSFRRREGTDAQRPKLSVTYTSAAVGRKPISDVSITGWTSTGATVYEVIDEDTPSDADYATSPAITGSGQPAILGLQNTPLAAGTWAVAVRAAASTGTPTLRVKLLNDSNAEQGSADVVVSTTPTRYDLTITTSGAATRISFEFITA
jgi:hypothetical protein